MTALSETLDQTLHETPRKCWRYTAGVHVALNATHPENPVSRAAVANRLQRLRALKLVACVRVGKEKKWRRV